MPILSNSLLLLFLSIIFASIKIVDYLIRRRNDTELLDKFSDYEKRLENIEETSLKNWEMHNRYDENGVPLWYTPRSWANYQEKIAASQEKLGEHMVTIAHTLSVVVNITERIERNLDKIEARHRDK